MSAKPASVARWANVGGAITVPSSGKQDVGHVAGEAPTAEIFNWLDNLAYQWQQYLSDGNFTGNHTITGTFAVSGLASLNGGLAVVGGIAQTGGGSTALSGTLGVAGLITATGGVTSTALITANAGVTAGANQNVTVSGTGKFKHPTITDILSPFGVTIDSTAPATTITTSTGSILSYAGSAGSAFLMPLRVRIGQNISAIRIRCIDNSTGATKVSVQYGTDVDGVVTFNGNALSSGAGVWQTLTITPTTPLVASGKSYYLRFALSTSGSLCGISRIEIDYDQP